MSRTGLLAAGALGAGAVLTLALVLAASPPAPRASAPQTSTANAPPALGETLRRCRSVTAPDAACEAAWEQKRRRFFGKDKDEQ